MKSQATTLAFGLALVAVFLGIRSPVIADENSTDLGQLQQQIREIQNQARREVQKRQQQVEEQVQRLRQQANQEIEKLRELYGAKETKLENLQRQLIAKQNDKAKSE